MRAKRAGEVPSGARDKGPGETAILTIDLDAVAANYRTLCELAAPAECAAVVKADAYGLGMAQIAPTLWRIGCKTFFVATIEEESGFARSCPARSSTCSRVSCPARKSSTARMISVPC